MRQRLRSGTGSQTFLTVLAVAAAVVAACTSGTATPNVTATASLSLSATSSPISSSAPLATGPASFQLTATGDSNVTGTWGASFGIDCNNPTVDGLDILFFASSPDGKAVVLVTLKQGAIGVSERAGAGAAYTDREFTGSGVTAFDPTRGASFDSDLSIVPSPQSNPGALGTIAHVAGSIDCAGQRPGISTIVLNGSSAEGSIAGPFSSFRVTCTASTQNGASVGIVGIINAGPTPTLVNVSLRERGGSTIFSSSESPSIQRSYAIDKAGSVTLSATGAHVDADFIEALAAGTSGPPHRIHLSGDVTCGIFTSN